MKVIDIKDVTIYRVQCGYCLRYFFASSEEEAKERLIEHLNEFHGGD